MYFVCVPYFCNLIMRVGFVVLYFPNSNVPWIIMGELFPLPAKGNDVI